MITGLRYVLGLVAAAMLASQTVHAQDTEIFASDIEFGPGGVVEVGDVQGVSPDIVASIRTMESHGSLLSYRFNLSNGSGAVRVRFPETLGEIEVVGVPGAFEVVASVDVPLPIPGWVRDDYPYAVRADNPERLFVNAAKIGNESLSLDHPIYDGPVEFVDVFFAQDPRSGAQADTAAGNHSGTITNSGGWCIKIWVAEFHRWWSD